MDKSQEDTYIYTVVYLTIHRHCSPIRSKLGGLNKACKNLNTSYSTIRVQTGGKNSKNGLHTKDNNHITEYVTRARKSFLKETQTRR